MLVNRRNFLKTGALTGLVLALSAKKAHAPGIKDEIPGQGLKQVSRAPNFPYSLIEKINPDLSDSIFQILGTEVENRMVINRLLKQEGLSSEAELDEVQRRALLVDLCHYRAVADCLPLILGLGYLARYASAVINPYLVPKGADEKIIQGITSANTFTAQSALLITYFPGLLTKVRDAYVEEMAVKPELGNNPNAIPVSERLKICWRSKRKLVRELGVQTKNFIALPFNYGTKLAKPDLNAYIDLMLNLAGYIISTNNISEGRFVLNATRSAAINRRLSSAYQGDEEGKRRLSSNSASNSIAWTLLFGVSGMAQPIARFFGLCPPGSTDRGTINIQQFMGDFVRTLAQWTGKRELMLLLRKAFERNLLDDETKSVLWSYIEEEIDTVDT